ncbi:5724_t:CDS:2 [Ambispora gerdemannii]|uniref:5724_t:CDS:1 n=1 Tax=Ambispora gerdemannii TaxID=144530 RepID=A0A9N9FV12_9GLOM|nr:5724_t:CDS:2 [Ambispora gerdemannii]
MEDVEHTKIISSTEGREVTSTTPSIEEIKKWSPEQVITFLKSRKNDLYLREQDIKIIEDNWVAGQAFLRLNEEKLMQDGLSRGPAESIAYLIKTLKGEEASPYLSQDVITEIHEMHSKLTQPTIETISISKINTENFQLLKNHLNLDIENVPFNNIPIYSNASPPAFEWKDKSEPAHKDEYLKWLHKYIPLANGRIWYDVGGNHSLLYVYKDSRLPFNVHGGIDVVVVNNYDVSSRLIPESIYAVLELKKKIERNHVMQVILEMVIADLITPKSRIVFGIISDLTDDWQIFWLEDDRTIKSWNAPSRNVAIQVLSELLRDKPKANRENTSIIIPAAKRVKLSTLLPDRTISEDDIARIEDVYDVMSKEEIWRHKVGVASEIVRNIPSFSSMYA